LRRRHSDRLPKPPGIRAASAFDRARRRELRRYQCRAARRRLCPPSHGRGRSLAGGWVHPHREGVYRKAEAREWGALRYGRERRSCCSTSGRGHRVPEIPARPESAPVARSRDRGTTPMKPLKDFWLSCGHHLTDRDTDGGLLVTDEFLKAYLARPELRPPPEACAAERALHTALLADPHRCIGSDEIAAIADADARENWRLMAAFRDHLLRH